MAAEGETGSSGGQSPLKEACGDTVAPKSPDWDSDGEWWSEREGLSASDFREHNEESLALHVMGQNWSSEKVSLFLEDWELARVALRCHVALDMLCQAMHEAWWAGSPLAGEPTVTASESFSLTVDGL